MATKIQAHGKDVTNAEYADQWFVLVNGSEHRLSPLAVIDDSIKCQCCGRSEVWSLNADLEEHECDLGLYSDDVVILCSDCLEAAK